MAWVITKTQSPTQYFLKRASMSGKATWTTNHDLAIHYSSAKAASYAASIAKIQNYDIIQIII